MQALLLEELSPLWGWQMDPWGNTCSSKTMKTCPKCWEGAEQLTWLLGSVGSWGMEFHRHKRSLNWVLERGLSGKEEEREWKQEVKQSRPWCHRGRWHGEVRSLGTCMARADVGRWWEKGQPFFLGALCVIAAEMKTGKIPNSTIWLWTGAVKGVGKTHPNL